MLFTTTLLALSTVATGVKAGKTYMVDIMNGSFYPDITTADEGDIVAFNFVGGTYGIVQASYASPCSPLIGGMFSGYYDSSSAENWTWNVNVTNKEPVFFYAADQCQQGMVGVINPPQWLLNCLHRYPEVAAQYPEPSIPKDTPASGGYYEQQPPAVPEAHGFPYAPFSNSSAPPKIVYQSPCPPPIKEEPPAVISPVTTIFTSSCSEATIVTVPGGSVYNATANEIITVTATYKSFITNLTTKTTEVMTQTPSLTPPKNFPMIPTTPAQGSGSDKNMAVGLGLILAGVAAAVFA